MCGCICGCGCSIAHGFHRFHSPKPNKALVSHVSHVRRLSKGLSLFLLQLCPDVQEGRWTCPEKHCAGPVGRLVDT